MKRIFRWMLVSSFLCFLGLANAQQVSRTIDTHNDQGLEGVRQIIAQDSGYLMFIVKDLFVGDYNYRVPGLVRTDERGDTIWTYAFDGVRDSLWFIPNANTCVVIDDTIYFQGLVTRKDYTKFLRFVAVSMQGKTLYWRDVEPPKDKPYTRFYSNQMIEGNDHSLVLTGNIKLKAATGRSCWLMKLDHKFNVLIQNFPFIPNRLIYHVRITRSPEGGYMVGLSGDDGRGEVIHYLYRIDENLRVLWHKDFEFTSHFRDALRVVSIKDNYIIGSSYKVPDSALTELYLYPYASYVAMINATGDILWEHVFIDTFENGIINLIVTRKENILGAGGRGYYGPVDYSVELENGRKISSDSLFFGWAFLLDTAGALRWERTIADSKFDRPVGFWDGIDTRDGYILVGDADKENPSKEPFWNDTDVWWVSLDSAGCWNGNCSSRFVIVNDSTALNIVDPWDSLLQLTFKVKEVKRSPEVKLYPNPTTDGICFDWPNLAVYREKKELRIYDLQGKERLRLRLYAGKRSYVDLSSLPAGRYLITILDKSGHLLQTSKVIKR